MGVVMIKKFSQRARLFIIFALLVATISVYFLYYHTYDHVSSSTMHLTSTTFEHNSIIPSKYTCDGDNISPALAWSGVPADAKSLALIVDDPDAPDGLWVHWLMWDISASETGIAENSIPKDAVQGINSGGKAEYAGPCPPDHEHRYFFKLYALDIELDLPTTTDKEELEEAMVGHVLDHAELVGSYDRVKK